MIRLFYDSKNKYKFKKKSAPLRIWAALEERACGGHQNNEWKWKTMILYQYNSIFVWDRLQ